MAKEKKSGSFRIYGFYWLMLAYMLAALTWWFIELNRQNDKMVELRSQIEWNDANHPVVTKDAIQKERKRKFSQYAGEGITFFILIAASGVLFFRAVRKQLKTSREQQHFMMAVTHELKTPIAVATLNLETIKKRELDNEKRDKLIGMTIQELHRLNALCNNLLLSSQIESEAFATGRERTDISGLAEKCSAEFLARYPGRRIQFSGMENAFVHADPFLLEIAVNNLLDNAVKYSPKEGSIWVNVDTTGNSIRLSVSDEGFGIPMQEKTLVLRKFYRTGNEATRNAKGTGLGLFIVHKVAEAHGGEIQISDHNPKGTIVELLFPKKI